MLLECCVYSVRALEGEEALVTGIKNAVRLGADTDTIAAIAGGLLGAAWGASSVPDGWRERGPRLASDSTAISTPI